MIKVCYIENLCRYWSCLFFISFLQKCTIRCLLNNSSVNYVATRIQEQPVLNSTWYLYIPPKETFPVQNAAKHLRIRTAWLIIYVYTQEQNHLSAKSVITVVIAETMFCCIVKKCTKLKSQHTWPVLKLLMMNCKDSSKYACDLGWNFYIICYKHVYYEQWIQLWLWKNFFDFN